MIIKRNDKQIAYPDIQENLKVIFLMKTESQEI